MSLMSLLFAVVVIVLIVWLFQQARIPEPIRTILLVIGIFGLLALLLNGFGVFHNFNIR